MRTRNLGAAVIAALLTTTLISPIPAFAAEPTNEQAIESVRVAVTNLAQALSIDPRASFTLTSAAMEGSDGMQLNVSSTYTPSASEYLSNGQTTTDGGITWMDGLGGATQHVVNGVAYVEVSSWLTWSDDGTTGIELSTPALIKKWPGTKWVSLPEPGPMSMQFNAQNSQQQTTSALIAASLVAQQLILSSEMGVSFDPVRVSETPGADTVYTFNTHDLLTTYVFKINPTSQLLTALEMSQAQPVDASQSTGPVVHITLNVNALGDAVSPPTWVPPTKGVLKSAVIEAVFAQQYLDETTAAIGKRIVATVNADAKKKKTRVTVSMIASTAKKLAGTGGKVSSIKNGSKITVKASWRSTSSSVCVTVVNGKVSSKKC